MLIKSFCVGNHKKSFYIDLFKEGINIIHSDDNDKGKTIVSQGIMYSLGNTPCFPSGFDDFKDYYFITEIENNSESFLICRRKDFIFVKKNDEMFYSFDSVNEFKRFFSKNIMTLPLIKSSDFDTLVGLELFFEMFFMPQDNRTTSNIFNKGRYNKEDYIDMLYSLKGAVDDTTSEEIELIRKQIKEMKQRRQVVFKSLKFLKSKNFEVRYASYALSKEMIENKMKILEKLQSEFSELINKKNRLINKKLKNEVLLKEINSLKRSCEEGRLVCMRCGYDKIAYETADPNIRFEVTDLDTRNEISKIIKERIRIILEDLTDLEVLITNKRNEINSIMKDENLSLENYLLYKSDVLAAQKYDAEIVELDKTLERLNNQLQKISYASKEKPVTKKQVIDQYVELMNCFYKKINPDDPLIITSPFTKSDINYSGSQGVLYIMARYFAAAKMTDYNFPLIIDDFRDGEISTAKEARILDELKGLKRQVLLTCTLKAEERVKYEDINYVNDISFNHIEKFHLMSEEYNLQFVNQLSRLNIKLDIQDN